MPVARVAVVRVATPETSWDWPSVVLPSAKSIVPVAEAGSTEAVRGTGVAATKRVAGAVRNLFDTPWRQAQFANESRLPGEPGPVSDLHFTPGYRSSVLR